MAILGVLTVGCDDPPAEPENTETPDSAPPQPAAAKGSWLAVDDPRPPALWLAERESGRELGGDDPEVQLLQGRLDAAETQFHESRRMLANRTAQLTDVSREHGDDLPPAAILADMTFPSADGSKLWFGVLMQAYIVLRENGSTHAEAIAVLRQQYGQ